MPGWVPFLHFAPLDLPVQGGDLDLSTHGGLVDRHRLVQVDVAALPAQPAWGITLMPTIRSPAGPPLRPMSPLASDGDGLAIVDAGGDFDVDLLLPAHTAAAAAGFAFLMDDLPSPRQLGQTVEVDMVPNTVRCWTRTWPLPWHSGQISAVVPGSQPVPPQTSQASTCWMFTSFSQPKAASSRVRVRLVRTVLPWPGRCGRRRRPHQSPQSRCRRRRTRKRSPMSKPPNPPNPPPAPPAPKLGSTPAKPNWSYLARLSLSERTS